MLRKRIEWIDSLRGFAIFLVVLGHVCQFGFSENGNQSILFRLIYSFHMPLFFFISGYSRGLASIPLSIIKLCRQLLLPFAIWAFIKMIIERDLSFMHCLWILRNPAGGGLWFLWVLFYLSLIVSLVRTTLDKWFAYIICFIVFALCAYILDYKFGTWEMMVYFPFFVIGMKIHEVESWLKSVWLFSFYPILCFCLAALFVTRIWYTSNTTYCSDPLDVTISLFMCLFVYMLFSQRNNLLCNRRISIIGRSTLGIYAMHYYVLFLSRFASNHFGYTNNSFLAIVISLPVLYLSFWATRCLEKYQITRILLLGRK